MRLFLLSSFLFLYCNYAVASVCEGAFEKKIIKKSSRMTTWSWNYSTSNTSFTGDQKEYDVRLSLGAAEDKACVESGKCVISASVCAVKTSLKSLLNEIEQVDKPIRVRVISYGVYFSLYERVIDDMRAGQSCEQTYENYYMALSNFWTEALSDVGYEVTDVHPFEVKFEEKPEYLNDDECFHRVDQLKAKIASLKIPGNSSRLAWGRIGFGVSWYGTDFFPAFDIEKIAK